MIEEQDYRWYPPSENCKYTGYPLPLLDILNKPGKVVKKEDICYLADWAKELKAIVNYGFRSRYWNGKPNLGAEFKTEVWHKTPIVQIDDAIKDFYLLSVGIGRNMAWNTYGTLCPFTTGSSTWGQYWNSLTSWHGSSSLSSSTTWEGFHLVPKPESRLLSTSLSDVCTVEKGYPPGLTSLVQDGLLQYTACPNADVIRKLYYDLNRLTSFGCGTAFYNVHPGTIDYSIKGYDWKYAPWMGQQDLPIAIGPLGDDDATISACTDTYLSGNFISSDVHEVTCTSRTEFVPYGQPVHGIYSEIYYVNPSSWTAGTPKVDIQYYKCRNPKYIVNPVLKGKLEFIGVWEIMRCDSIRWMDKTYDNNIYYAFRFKPIWKAADLPRFWSTEEPFECWEDDSKFWNDSKNMVNDMKAAILSLGVQHGDFMYCHISKQTTGAYFFKLGNEWKYPFENWNWTP